MNLPSIDQLKQRVGQLVNKKVVKPVQSYFAPTENVRARDFAREVVTTGIPQTARGLVSNTERFVRQSGNVFGTALAYHNPGKIMGNYDSKYVPMNDLPTQKQLLGSTAGSILELAPYSSKLRGVMAGGKLLNSVNPVVRTAAGALPGYAYDVASHLSQGQDTKKAVRPGLGTLFGGISGFAAKPVAADLTQAGKDLQKVTTKSVRSKIDGKWMTLQDIEEDIIKKNREAGNNPMFTDEIRKEALRIAKLYPQRVFEEVKDAVPRSVTGGALQYAKNHAGLSVEDVSKRPGFDAYVGRGGKLDKLINGTDELGRGSYFSRDPSVAQKFGNVEKVRLNLNEDEILRINNQQDYDDFVKAVIKKYPGDIDTIAPNMAAYAKKMGYKAIEGAPEFDELAGINVLDPSVIIRGKKPIMPEPSVDNLPLLSGRTPLKGVNDQRPSALDQAKLLTKPQELNVNNLNLTPEQRIEMQGIGANPNPTRMSNDAVRQAALGADPLTAPIGMGGTLDDTARGLATRQQAVNQMRELTELRKSGASTDEIARKILEVAKANKIAASVGTDAGRKLQAQKILADEFDAPMQKVFKLLDNAGIAPEKYAKAAAKVDFENPQQVVKFYRSFVPAQAGEWLDVVRYNSMLSSPLTQIVNITSNTVGSGFVRPVTKALTGGVDFVGSTVTGKPQTQFAGEGLAHSKGYWSSVGKGWDDLVAVMSGKQDMGTMDFNHMPIGAQSGLGKVTENTLSFPTRLLEGMDRFFMALSEGGESAALQYRQSKGVAVPGFDELVKKEARRTVFRGDLVDPSEGALDNLLGTGGQAILNARHSQSALARFISKYTAPFITTPTNILKQGAEFTPGVGLVNLFGGANKQEIIAKQIFGASAFLGASALFANGRTTWGEPTNQKQKNEFRAAGMQPYSVKIGDTWYAYNKLHPAIAFPIALVAALEDAKKNKGLTDDEVDTAMATVAKFAQFFADQSYMKSFGAFMDAFKGGESAAANIASNYLQQLVPFRAFGGWITRMIDDVQRKVDPSVGFLEKQQQLLKLNIPLPGMYDTVPTRNDQFGTPIPAQNPVFNSLSPVRASTEDPLMKGFYDQHQTELKEGREQRQLKEMLERGETPQEVSGTSIPATDAEKYMKAYGYDSLVGEQKPLDTFEGALAKAQRERDLVKMITDNRIPDAVQDAIVEKMGLNDTDIQFLALKSMTNEVAAPFIHKMLVGGSADDLKKAIREDLLTYATLDEMFKQGIIDADTRWKTRDFIKAYKTELGLLKGPKGKKAPKRKAIKFKTSLQSFNTKTVAQKKPRTSVKPIKFTPPVIDLKPFKV